MSNIQRIQDVDVDRREETVTTNQPGYTTTEQVIRDVAAERRFSLFQITRIIWTFLALLEVLLGFRVLLKLIGANPESGFAWFVYGISELFLKPFTDLIPNWSRGDMVLEATTLFAMVIYALVFWGLVGIIRILADRPSTTSVTRSTHEQTPGGRGNERTTHTTRSG